MIPPIKIVCYLAIIVLSISASVSAKKSDSTPEITLEFDEQVTSSKNLDHEVNTESSDPIITSKVINTPPEVSEKPEYEPLGCKCNKASKDGSKKSKIQSSGEKERDYIESKKSGKKIRVITIAIPVETEGLAPAEITEKLLNPSETMELSDLQLGMIKVNKKLFEEESEAPVTNSEEDRSETRDRKGDEQETSRILKGSSEVEGEVPTTKSEEEFVEATNPKKHTKLGKKRSKRETKVYKDKEYSKSKGEKKSKRGKTKN